jgi:DNA/RNA endonuclease YhcR with UshA esterase domain
MITYPPGQRLVVRDEEWLVRRTQPAHAGNAVHVVGLSELVRGQEAIFLDAIDKITFLTAEETELVPDPAPSRHPHPPLQ